MNILAKLTKKNCNTYVMYNNIKQTMNENYIYKVCEYQMNSQAQ